MRARLRFGLGRRLAAPLPRRTERGSGAMKGVMRNIIVVRPPDPRFREALFILRDDYFLDPDKGREQLLQEAKEAARSYAETAAPRRPRRFPFWAVPLLLAAVTAGLRVTGVI